MGRGSLFGMILGIAIVVCGVLLGGSTTAFWNLPSLIIVLGGTIATTMVKFPPQNLLGTLIVARQAFFVRSPTPEELVPVITRLARDVRRNSILAMEKVPIEDPFLRRAVGLAVDGAAPAVIESFLRSEVAAELDRHERGERIFRAMGASAPAFGMIGTLIGLVQMLAEMDDPSKIGPAMAVAILTTFYGVTLAYLVFIPIADKLSERSRAEWMTRELTIQGFMAIMHGQHPSLVERRLYGLLGPGTKANGAPPKNRLRPAA